MKWIKLDKIKPVDRQQIIASDCIDVFEAIFNKKDNNGYEPYYGQDIVNAINFTHWMPMPKPPKK